MPSDERSAGVLRLLGARVERFRTLLAEASAEMEEYLASHRARDRGRADEAAHALGPFASGRIDLERFGAVLTDARALAPEEAALIGECAAILRELLQRGDALFVREVLRGEQMRRVVEAAIADIGRGLGAARVFRAVKARRYRAARHGSLLVGLPFTRWTRAERDLAPPLVLEVEGADIRAEQLVEYLDGTLAIVCVVSGETSPAPLVRLISPATFVMQTDDAASLARLADVSGPVVAALVPATSARFTHDPRGGARLDERLTIERVPTASPRERLGWRSVQQSSDELAQLAALAELIRAAREVSVVVVPPRTDGLSSAHGAGAVDAVANWMLAQAGFAGGAP